MATFNRFNKALEHSVEECNWASDTFKVMLTNTLPIAANEFVADITEIAAGNGYTAGGFTLSKIASDTSGAAGRLRFSDAVPAITASGGSIGPFRYAVVYDDTAASKPLMGWYDYGSAITLLTGEPFNFDMTDANGIMMQLG